MPCLYRKNNHVEWSFGSVKTIRTCQPQPSNGGASSASRSGKADGVLYSNKVSREVDILPWCSFFFAVFFLSFKSCFINFKVVIILYVRNYVCF